MFPMKQAVMVAKETFPAFVLYQFSLTTVIIYYKLSGLNKTSLLFHCSVHQKINTDLIRLRSGCWWVAFLSGASREESFSMPSPASRGRLFSVAYVSFFLSSKNSIMTQVLLTPLSLRFFFLIFLSAFKDSCDNFGSA